MLFATKKDIVIKRTIMNSIFLFLIAMFALLNIVLKIKSDVKLILLTDLLLMKNC